MSRRWLAPILGFSLALFPGCAGLLRSYDVSPEGLRRSDAELRQALVAGRADSLLVQRTLSGEAAPGDELLRTLYGGIAAFYAGRYQESGNLLDVASVLAEARATKSLTRSALSLISNDQVLPYETSRTERLLIPYYGAQAYLRLNDITGAAVEARRLAGLLEVPQGDVHPETARLHATLRYFTGAVFEAAGERNDASVAYRHAGGLAGLDTVAPATSPDSGDVVLFVDYGFVAHRVEEALTVLLAPHEVYGLHDGHDHERLGLAEVVSRRVLAQADSGGAWPHGPLFVTAPVSAPPERCRGEDRSGAPGIGTVLGKPDSSAEPVVRVVSTRPSDGCRDLGGYDDDDDDRDAPYLLRVAWPSYRWTSRTPARAELAYADNLDSAGHFSSAPGAVSAVGDALELMTGSAPLGTVTFADVSQAVFSDFRAELPLIVARTIARGVAKAAITEGAERTLEKKHEGLGAVVGIVGNVGNVLLERADTRSWQLLPGGIGVVRVRLPAGQHDLRVQLEDGRQLPLPAVQVRGGQLDVVTMRAW